MIRMLSIFLTAFSGLFATTAAAQIKWFTPDKFSVTCQLTQECFVNQACKPVAKSLTINHDNTQGFSNFVFPDGEKAQGVVGVISAQGTQTLAATASTNAQKMYRITVFPDAAITVGVLNYIDRPEDVILYGTCKSPVS